jgi:hypothetical protein
VQTQIQKHQDCCKFSIKANFQQQTFRAIIVCFSGATNSTAGFLLDDEFQKILLGLLRRYTVASRLILCNDSTDFRSDNASVVFTTRRALQVSTFSKCLLSPIPSTKLRENAVSYSKHSSLTNKNQQLLRKAQSD